MNELKDYSILDIEAIDDERFKKETAPGKWVMESRVYLKSEADKVIAELKQKINEAQTELELWRDGSIISEAHQKELDEKRHSNYKRCLAMAQWCAADCVVNQNTYKKFLTQKSEFRITHFRKWYFRWLELAEKFKEAK